MTKFKVEVDIESEEKEQYVKKILIEILETLTLTDSVNINKIKINKVKEKEEEDSYFGIAIREVNSYRGITMSLFKPRYSFGDAKRINMQYLDPSGNRGEEIVLNEAFTNPIIQQAIWNYFKPEEIRKVIDNAINRAREAAANEDTTSEA